MKVYKQIYNGEGPLDQYHRLFSFIIRLIIGIFAVSAYGCDYLYDRLSKEFS